MYYISTPGDGRSAILRILNIISNKNYTLEDVEFSQPVSNNDVIHNRNTKVTVFFKPEKGLYGQKNIYYNRIHINDLPVLTVSRGSATTYHELIPVLNSVYNLHLSTIDIDNGPLPDIVSSSVTITLPVSNASYLYYDDSQIITNGFTPNYNLFKPSHTLLMYLCDGFDKYGQYSDNVGGTYRKLVQHNSHDCGFEDGLPRLNLTIPTLSALEEDNSGIFTIELQNPVSSVTVTIASDGLNISQNTFVLDTNNTTGTFTVSSNTPGIYEITVSNDQLLTNPNTEYFSVIDRYNTTYTVTAPTQLTGMVNVDSEVFTINGYNIDPDEPIVITLHTTLNLNTSVQTIELTSTQTSGTFTVNSTTEGSYFISFTNNRNLSNPTQIPYSVIPAISLSLTSPVTHIVETIESGLFTVTLLNGIEDVTVTPVVIGSSNVTPSNFILTPSQPSGSFRVTFPTAGNYSVGLTNNTDAINPANTDITVLDLPNIIVTEPVNDIYTGVQSDVFTVELIDGFEPVAVSITSNVDNLSINSINLTPANPTATFRVTEATEGNYFVQFTNNKSYPITSRIDFVVNRTLVPHITLVSPSLNVETNQATNNFTLELIDHNGPVTVTINTPVGVTATPNQVVLNSTTPTATFTLTSTTYGTKNITFTNSASITNPNAINLNVREADFVELTTIPTNIRANTLSGNFVVTLLNPYSEIVVTPVSSNATFTPSFVTLNTGTPSATFKATYSVLGAYNLDLITNPLTPVTPTTEITVLEQLIPTLTLTNTQASTYPGDNSSVFTVTLTNYSNDVLVTINTSADSSSVSSFTLNEATPSNTFTITDTQAGNYNVSITNNAGITNPTQLNYTISNDTGSLQFTGPTVLESEAFEASGNFTVTGVNLVRDVVVTPVTTGNYTFNPASLTLTPAQPTGTFTLNSDNVGVKSVSITNNRGYSNPNPINYEFTIPTVPYYEVTADTSQTTEEDSTPLSFTVTGNNLDSTVIVSINAWTNSGLSTATVTLTVAEPIKQFTIAPQDAGNFNLSFTNNSAISDPASIPITVTIKPTLQLNRIGSGNILMDNDLEFNVSILNPRNEDTEITIVLSDPDLNISGFTPPLILNQTTTSQSFFVNSHVPDVYQVSVSNNKSLTNPTPISFEINQGSIGLTTPANLNFLTSVESGNFTVTLTDYDKPTIVTINITNFSDGVLETNFSDVVLEIDPTVAYSNNQMLLSSSNRTGTFTVTKPTEGQIVISLSTNKDLIVPANETCNFFANALLALMAPIITRDLINQSIPIKVGITNPVEDVLVEAKFDKLGTDPYKNNVTLFLDFSDPIGNVFTDLSPANNAVTTVGNASITTANPIYGSRVGIFDGNGDYLYCSNVTDFHFPGDFTLEADLIITNSSESIFDTYTSGIPGYYHLWINSNGFIEWTCYKNSTHTRYTCTTNVATGNLCKVAVSRVSGILRIFVNGIKEYEIEDTIDYSPSTSSVTMFGMCAQINQRNSSYDFTGRVGKIKVTKGVGRYINNYTPEILNTELTIVPTSITLGASKLNDTFNISSALTGTYCVKMLNNKSLTNPSSQFLTFESLPTISIIPDLSPTFVGDETGLFTVNLTNATVPVDFTFSLSSGLTVSTTPQSWDGNKFTLSENLPSISFKLLSTGTNETLAINNNKNLTNPDIINLTFTYNTILSFIPSTNTQVFINDVISDLQIKISNPNEITTVTPIVDYLTNDPYANNVALLVDFNTNIDDTVFLDLSPRRKIFDYAGTKKIAYSNIEQNEKCGLFYNDVVTGGAFWIAKDSNLESFSDFNIATNDFTIEIILEATQESGSCYLLEYRNSGSTFGLLLTINGLGFVKLYFSGTELLSSTTNVLNFSKHHIAVTRKNGLLKLFINGVKESSYFDDRDYTFSTANFYSIGRLRNYQSESTHFKGKIYFIRHTAMVSRYNENFIPDIHKKVCFTPGVVSYTTHNESYNFTVKTPYVGDYLINLYSNKTAVKPSPLLLQFEKISSISLIEPNTKSYLVNTTSNEYEIRLNDPSLDVKITIILQSGLQFVNQPTNLTGVNEITLNENNSTSRFTVTSAINGLYSITLTNDKGLTNPITNYCFFGEENSDPLFISEFDFALNLNVLVDNNTDLNIKQTII